MSAGRVCHITTVHPVGDHRILHKECLSLRAAGYDVTLIAPHEGDTVAHGVPVVALPDTARNRLERMARRPLAAYRAAVALDADVYHFHDPEFLPYGVRLARGGKRVIYDAHEDVPVQMRYKEWIPAPARAGAARAFARFEAECVARMDAVVTPSVGRSTGCAGASRARSSSPTTRVWRRSVPPRGGATASGRRATSAASRACGAPRGSWTPPRTSTPSFTSRAPSSRPRCSASSRALRAGRACATRAVSAVGRSRLCWLGSRWG